MSVSGKMIEGSLVEASIALDMAGKGNRNGYRSPFQIFVIIPKCLHHVVANVSRINRKGTLYPRDAVKRSEDHFAFDFDFVRVDGGFKGKRNDLEVLDDMIFSVPILELLLHEIAIGFSAVGADVHQIVG